MRRLLSRPELGAVAGTIAVWIFFAIVAGDRGFLSMRGTANYLEVAAQLGILAVAVALLMIGGEFDLSIGSTIGACGMILALLSVEYGWNIWLAALASLVFALLLGAFNGILVLRTGLPSFIITLGTLLIIRGVTSASRAGMTGRTSVGGLRRRPGIRTAHPLGFRREYRDRAARISRCAILWWLGWRAVATWVLMRTSFGNWIFGVGGNVQAARNVGVPVSLVKITLFMATAAAAWLVAVIQVWTRVARTSSAAAASEFTAIIAAVIGGTLLTGGYGSAIGACSVH